ncbi:hypothetical protein SCHPADRAFT_901679 [Schizopora paradoxa]|uniref:Uncharacterized protein n=1 Tax=Schizopora paradoxa TaxID=27342 RepID=A0A0H2RXE8_9AGAM|nr:hypothetical protein SCHPADRAFT_901679 [Schizopora paradoxa]
MQSFNALSRTDTHSSSAHSTATAPNLVGPGRTLGLLFDWLGNGLETFLNRRAVQLNLGPEAVARVLDYGALRDALRACHSSAGEEAAEALQRTLEICQVTRSVNPDEGFRRDYRSCSKRPSYPCHA